MSNNPVPSTMPPLVPVTSISSPASTNPVPPRKTLQETIKDIESSISVLEIKGVLNPRQEQDLAKLKELHTRALAEQERIMQSGNSHLKHSLKTSKIPPAQQQQQSSSSSSQPNSSAKSPGASSVSAQASNSTPNNTSNSSSSAPTASTAMAPPAGISSPSPSPRGGIGPVTNRPVDPNQVLNKKKLQDLVKEIDPNTQLDDDVEEMMLQVADDFIENIVTAGCQLAKHRKSGTLEVKDILLHLEIALPLCTFQQHRCLCQHLMMRQVLTKATVLLKRTQKRNWNMMIPGYGSDEGRSFKRPASTEAHKQRMALIRKTLKK